MGLFKYLDREINLLFAKLVLSTNLRERADRYMGITIQEFRRRHKRKPNRNEIFLLVVKASHRTLGIRSLGGKRGHIKRQWIRKYLLLKNNIRDKYKIQKERFK